MSMGKIVIITLAAGLAGIGAGMLGQKYFSPGGRHTAADDLIPQPIQVRKTLPELALPDLDGREHRSTEWAGKVLVLNFWATWCPPCRREMPTFRELQDQYGNQGLQFVGIAIDDPEAVRSYRDETDINFPILLGGEAAIGLSRELGNRLQGLPFSVIFDRNGKVVHAQAGELTRATVEQKIQGLL